MRGGGGLHVESVLNPNVACLSHILPRLHETFIVF